MQPKDTPPAKGLADTTEWFRHAFDEFYLHLYAHRDLDEAERFVATLRERFALRGPVLDVACGPGRFLRALAGEEQVFGLDLSRPLLHRARQILRREPPPLIRADMRRLPVRSGSQAWALLLFTSFGYFAHEREDEQVLRELARVLARGGRLALDFLNAAEVVRTLVPESRREVAGRDVREVRWLDGPFLRKRVVVRASGFPEAVYDERIRLYSAEELRALLESAGLEVRAVLGDYAGREFDRERSPRCILISGKPGEPGGTSGRASGGGSAG